MDLAEYYTSVFHQAAPFGLHQLPSIVTQKEIEHGSNNNNKFIETQLLPMHDYQSSYFDYQQQLSPSSKNHPNQHNQHSPSYSIYSNKQHSPSCTSYPDQPSPVCTDYLTHHSQPSATYPSHQSPCSNDHLNQHAPFPTSYLHQHSPSSILYSSQQSPHYPSQHSPRSDYGSLSDSPVHEEALSPSSADSTQQHYSDVSPSIKQKSRNSSTKSSKVPKIPALEVLQKRRLAANGRERKRMTSINEGFDRLRKVLPGFKDRDLSKFESLQMATSYILELAEILKSQ